MQFLGSIIEREMVILSQLHNYWHKRYIMLNNNFSSLNYMPNDEKVAPEHHTHISHENTKWYGTELKRIEQRWPLRKWWVMQSPIALLLYDEEGKKICRSHLNDTEMCLVCLCFGFGQYGKGMQRQILLPRAIWFEYSSRCFGVFIG